MGYAAEEITINSLQDTLQDFLTHSGFEGTYTPDHTPADQSESSFSGAACRNRSAGASGFVNITGFWRSRLSSANRPYSRTH